VQDAVYDDAVQFFVVGFPELLGIGTDGVERYDKVAVDLVFLNHRGQILGSDSKKIAMKTGTHTQVPSPDPQTPCA